MKRHCVQSMSGKSTTRLGSFAVLVSCLCYVFSYICFFMDSYDLTLFGLGGGGGGKGANEFHDLW